MKLAITSSPQTRSQTLAANNHQLKQKRSNRYEDPASAAANNHQLKQKRSNCVEDPASAAANNHQLKQEYQYDIYGRRIEILENIQLVAPLPAEEEAPVVSTSKRKRSSKRPQPPPAADIEEEKAPVTFSPSIIFTIL